MTAVVEYKVISPRTVWVQVRGFSGLHEAILHCNVLKFEQWVKGHGHIQNMLPELSADDRELLISGTTSEEWEKLFPEEE